MIVARMIPSRRTADVLSGHKWCLCRLGAVPRKGVYDNEGAIGRHRAGKMEFTREFLAFKGALGMGAVLLRCGFPEGKGVVERAIRYLETSFLPQPQLLGSRRLQHSAVELARLRQHTHPPRH